MMSPPFTGYGRSVPAESSLPHPTPRGVGKGTPDSRKPPSVDPGGLPGLACGASGPAHSLPGALPSLAGYGRAPVGILLGPNGHPDAVQLTVSCSRLRGRGQHHGARPDQGPMTLARGERGLGARQDDHGQRAGHGDSLAGHAYRDIDQFPCCDHAAFLSCLPVGRRGHRTLVALDSHQGHGNYGQ